MQRPRKNLPRPLVWEKNGGEDKVLFNLKTEIIRSKFSANKIAKAIGISPKAMSNKVTEKTQFTRDEMYAIQDKFFSEADMKYLFASDKEKRE